MRSNRDAQRYGKLVGTLRVKLARAIGRGALGNHERAHLDVPLRLDSLGVFHACHDGKWYDATTQQELHDKVKAAVDVSVELVWRRYIVIKYRAETSEVDETGFRTEGRYGSWLNLEEDRAVLAGVRHKRGHRADVSVITGISLDWDVVEYTDPFTPPEAPGKSVRSKRDVWSVVEDGKLVDKSGTSVREQDDDVLPAGCMLWTPAREEFLRQVRDALGKLDARMVSLFNGVGDELARRIDAAIKRSDRLIGDGSGT